MTRAGVFYPQPSWERRISEIGSGLWGTPRNSDGMKHALRNPDAIRDPRSRLEDQVSIMRWATPAAADAVGTTGGGQGHSLRTDVRMIPTPKARDYRTGMPKRVDQRREAGLSVDLNDQVGGQLNPTWVEWLMGFPLGWTDLRPVEMRKFRLWWQQHGGC